MSYLCHMKYVFDRHFGRLFEIAGMNVRRLLIEAHQPKDLFSRREILLSKEEYYKLMECAGHQVVEGTTLRVATEERIETFSPPIFAAYCSSNGENFMTRFSHYKRLIGPLRYLVYKQEGLVNIEIRGIDDSDQIPAFWTEIEMAFIVHLIRKATKEHVASKLCMSRRTLQRKLADEQTTFQQQLNATRLLLAKNYLKNSERTSDDIAFLLGYEDTTSFLRAFNMWTGMSITEYKKR